MKFEHGNLFSIDPEHVGRIKLAVGIMFLIGAVFNLFFPDPISLSTGRLSWIYRSVTEVFGQYGYPAIQAVIGLAIIFVFRSKSNRE